MSKRWKFPFCLLSEVAEVKRKPAVADINFPSKAFVIDSSFFSDFGNSLGLPQEIIGLKKRYVAYRGELCIQGSNPRIAFICPEEICLTNRDYFIVKPCPGKILNKYLMILFRSGLLEDQIKQLATGKRKLLGVRGARNLIIPFPPLEIQRKIVGGWDAHALLEISLRRKLKLSLDKLEYAVFGKQEKLAGVSEKTKEIAKSQTFWVKRSMVKGDFFSPEYYIPAPLGAKEKEAISIEDIVTIQGGLNISKDEWRQGGVPVYGSGNVLEKYFRDKPLGYISDIKNEKHGVLQDDILMCVIGEDSLGRSAVFSGDLAYTNQSLIRLSEKGTAFDPYYLTAYFNTNHFSKQITAHSRGVKQKYVRSHDLGKIKVILPDLERQKQLSEQYRKCATQLQKIKSSISPDRLSKKLVEKLLL